VELGKHLGLKGYSQQPAQEALDPQLLLAEHDPARTDVLKAFLPNHKPDSTYFNGGCLTGGGNASAV
jgi:hypothetical protein